MYSFDGDFRRKPQQNLGGSTHNSDRLTIIRNAQHERQKREQNRRETQSSTKIQSFVRSFLYRQRQKKAERLLYEQHLKGHGINGEKNLEILLPKLLFFYDCHTDGDRLITLCQSVLKNPQILYQKFGDVMWCHRLKKLLNCCMEQLLNQSHSSAIPLRMLEVFTDSDNVIKYIQNPYIVHQYLEVVFGYMIQKKYFQKLRVFINDRIHVEDEDDCFNNPIGDAIVQMLMRPLRLTEMANEALTEQILRSFCFQILSLEFTGPIKYFVIPKLVKDNSFPYVKMIKLLADIHQRQLDYDKIILIDIEPSKKVVNHIETPNFNTYLLYAVLVLDSLIGPHTDEKDFVRDYVKVLAALIHCIQKLPKGHSARLSGHDSDSDGDADNDHDIDMFSEMEINCLTTILGKLNETSRALFIVQRANWFLDEPEVLLNFCSICHALMTSSKSAVNEYKLLYMLAFKPNFIRSLWYTMTSQSVGKGLTAPISLISKGLAVPKKEADQLIPVLATFCALTGRLISTLHDGEFTNDNTIAVSEVMPFTLEELLPVSTMLKEICLGLVELAFPETRASLTEHYRSMLSSLHHRRDKTEEQINTHIWSHLLKVCVALLRQLHTRDLRLNYCPEGHWAARYLNLSLDKADLHISRSRRGLRPFQPIKDFTRDDLISDGPPLSTKQIRSITILREIPFVVEFNTRVSILQGLLAADKLRSQGDLQGFLQGPSINFVVRRSHLYEDAFDKLSLDNEPDLRPRFRVQLVNVTGLEEAGIDGGGVFREFLSELIKTAFDPHRGFFMITKDNMLYPNPGVGKIVEDFQRHYFFIGRILGKVSF